LNPVPSCDPGYCDQNHDSGQRDRGDGPSWRAWLLAINTLKECSQVPPFFICKRSVRKQWGHSWKKERFQR
jgi:hypothetical protein